MPVGESNNPSNSPAATISEEIRGYAALLDALKREQEALVAANVDAVLSTTAEKTELVAMLGRHAKARAVALRAMGYAAGPQGMNAWLEGAAGAVDREAWSKLTALAAEAKAQNARNGRLVRTQQAHWDRALSGLMRAAGVPATYGVDGRARHNLGGRGFGSI